MEKNIHSSNTRPKVKTSNQLVDIADYMDTNLDNHHKFFRHTDRAYNI